MPFGANQHLLYVATLCSFSWWQEKRETERKRERVGNCFLSAIFTPFSNAYLLSCRFKSLSSGIYDSG